MAGYLASLRAWMCNEASEQRPGAPEYQKHMAVDQVMHLGVSIRKGWKQVGDTAIVKWRQNKETLAVQRIRTDCSITRTVLQTERVKQWE